jgi:hypothetical protein
MVCMPATGRTACQTGTSASVALCVLWCCRYTASEALTALNKVYLMMMEANKGTNPAPMVVRHNACRLCIR